jgi:YggT family protein
MLKVIGFLNALVYIYTIILLAQAILSWIANPYRLGPNHPIIKIYIFLQRLTEPVVRPCRNFLSRFNFGPIDLSLWMAMIVIQIVWRVVYRILFAIALHI